MTIRTINNLSYTFAKKIDIQETRRFDKKTRFYSKQIRSKTQAKDYEIGRASCRERV